MSFVTALASCWDVCKHNCSHIREDDWPIDPDYWHPFFSELSEYRSPFWGLPQLNFDLYETHITYIDRYREDPFPYNQKKLDPPDQWGQVYIGITETDDKLVNSFLGWIFAITEASAWSGITVATALLFIFNLLILIVSGSVAPLFLLFNNPLTEKYKSFLQEIGKRTAHCGAFAALSSFRIFLPLIKAIIRIPVGIVIAAKAIIFPSPEQPVIRPALPPARVIRANFPSEWEGETRRERPGLAGYAEGPDLAEYHEELVIRFGEPSRNILLEFVQRNGRMIRHNRLLLSINSWPADSPLSREEINNRLEVFVRQVIASTNTLDEDEDGDMARAQRNSFYDTGSVHIPNVTVPQIGSSWQDILDKLNITTTNSAARYTCAISQCLMNQPFLIGDGQIYDRLFIETHLNVSNKSPLINLSIPQTQFKGVVLHWVNNEISAFVVALRAGYHLAKIKGEESTLKQKLIFVTANNISQMATSFRAQITPYIKNCCVTVSKKEREMLARRMVKDRGLVISGRVMATAWTYIKALTGSASADVDPASFLTLDPEIATCQFLEQIKVIDASLDNFVITALQEAMLEEQQVSRQFERAWEFDLLAQGELFEKLNNYLPVLRPKNLDNIAEIIAADVTISTIAIQYTLKLMQEPEKAIKFAEFEPEKIVKAAAIKEFLAEWYKTENTPFRTLFLITLKETILQERQLSLGQSQCLPKDQPVQIPQFGSVWNEEQPTIKIRIQVVIQVQYILKILCCNENLHLILIKEDSVITWPHVNSYGHDFR